MTFLQPEATKKRRAVLMEKVSSRTSTKHRLCLRHAMRTLRRKPQRSQQIFPHMDTPRSIPVETNDGTFWRWQASKQKLIIAFRLVQKATAHIGLPRIFLGCWVPALPWSEHTQR